jgi:Mg/Co/Ni transporter MgtE
MMTNEEREALDELLKTAEEVGPDWKDEILGIIEEDLAADAREDMKKDGLDDEETQDAIIDVVALKALWLAYNEAMSEVEDPTAREYLRRAIEGLPGTPATVTPLARPVTPVAPAGFTPPKVK